MTSVLDLVKHYQHTIEKYPNDEQRVLKCIDKLFNLGVTVQHLQDTGVGRTVNALRKEPGDVGQAARSLVYKWKLMVAAEESDQDNEQSNDNGSRKDSDDMSSQSRSKNDISEKKSNSDHRERKQELNGSYSGNKRKYHSSEEEEQNIRKSRHDSSSDSDHKGRSQVTIKKEKLNSESEDRDSNDSQSEDSDSEMSESSKEEVKVKEEAKKSHSKESRSSSSKHSSHNYHKESSKSKSSSSHEFSGKHSKHHISQSKDRHSLEKISNDKSSSYKHKSLSKEKEKEEPPEKKHKSHKSDSEKTKQQSIRSSSKDSSSDKHKSKHRSESSSKSENHKNTSKSSSEKEKKREEHKSSSGKVDKVNSSKNKSKDDGTNSKDKHSSSSKEKSKDRNSSKSSGHNEKKQSSSESKSRSNSKSKYDKGDDKNSDKKLKEKSSSSKEYKSSKTSTNKAKKEDIPKKKVPISSNTEDSDDGIDCGSGASFAEALGMISPVKPKKKTIKDTQSPINSFANDLSPAALLAPNAKLAPLPAIDISALPEISPNYKPRPPPKLLPHFTDEDAMSHVISSKNQRTKVYSGNKVIGKITSLYEMCVHVLQEHIDALEYTGGVPYEILKPVVDRATPQQLFVLEHYNPYLMEDTDHLWQKFCEKNFRNKQRQEMETWREMYMRCQEEQEHKLKSLTANIKMTQEAKKAPIKQTKMAYVDSVVKPPRNIAKKQAMHGTAHAATASPAARVAALSNTANVRRGGSVRPPPATPVSASSHNKPKKAPLMQKALQYMRGRKR